ncbi:hypothetical protein LX36DRAFT_651008 [Colletotrichum falcatum]|nr:hypothetical protein LX36DRAFT_651008 [Colletotrichum falcatum]
MFDRRGRRTRRKNRNKRRTEDQEWLFGFYGVFLRPTKRVFFFFPHECFGRAKLNLKHATRDMTSIAAGFSGGTAADGTNTYPGWPGR